MSRRILKELHGLSSANETAKPKVLPLNYTRRIRVLAPLIVAILVLCFATSCSSRDDEDQSLMSINGAGIWLADQGVLNASDENLSLRGSVNNYLAVRDKAEDSDLASLKSHTCVRLWGAAVDVAKLMKVTPKGSAVINGEFVKVNGSDDGDYNLIQCSYTWGEGDDSRGISLMISDWDFPGYQGNTVYASQTSSAYNLNTYLMKDGWYGRQFPGQVPDEPYLVTALSTGLQRLVP